MRMMKLALATSAAIVIGATSAHAITVKKRTEAPGLPPEIWEIAGEFCAIKNWHPAVAECEETKEGDATFRTLTLKDGGKIKEKLTGSDDLSYSYVITGSPSSTPPRGRATMMPRKSSPGFWPTASRASRSWPSRLGTKSIPMKPSRTTKTIRTRRNRRAA
jgi:hypothetical protein